ncbi:Nrd1 complex RNA-binding subunit [Aphanomyces cochlioides]|nr:Nrd1 complex RNA-binding subunit [Aphanomyces cochlioides]
MSISLDEFKAPNDKRKYRFSILSNGLKVLMIQCPDEDNHDTTTGYRASNEDEDEASLSIPINDANTYQAAACLTVEVGSFADPPCLQGLAHYLEHMLFMGTWQVRTRLLITLGSTKYPEENGFDSFLGQNGGYSNATTDCECTSYVFEVNSDSFKKALDMFASFFISPLLQPEAMDRELCAIESEFQLASQNDHVRRQVGLHNQKPTEYIRYVVSNKCAGSLKSRLGKSGWATNIIAGTSETDGYEFGSYGCLFEIQVTLTFEGLNHWVDVSTVVFEHLAMLQESRSLPNWIFEETIVCL